MPAALPLPTLSHSSATVVATRVSYDAPAVLKDEPITTVTLRDPENRTMRIDRAKIEDMRASPISLMPEGQLKTLSDKQTRDLFAYLMSKEPVK